MPVTKSAAKALRGSRRKRAVNLLTIKKYKQAVKTVRKATDEKKTDEAAKALPKAYAKLDKAGKKKVIPKGRVRRLKSRLAKAVARAGK